MGILYFLIAVISTTIGAISGLGGGVIIKPALDLFRQYDLMTISLLSSFTIFTMALVSTVKHLISGVSLKGQTVGFLIIGSILGGFLGKVLLTLINSKINNKDHIISFQSIVLSLLLLFVLVYLLRSSVKSFHIKSSSIIFLVGVLLGTIASFLGVGGGPFNVLLLVVLFSMDVKTAAIYSLIVILFSQSSKILSEFITNQFINYDLSMLFFMIPGGILGGLMGTGLNKKLDENIVHKLFLLLLILIIILNLYIAITSIK